MISSNAIERHERAHKRENTRERIRERYPGEAWISSNILPSEGKKCVIVTFSDGENHFTNNGMRRMSTGQS